MRFELSLRKNAKVVINTFDNLTEDDVDFVIRWLQRLDLEHIYESAEQSVQPTDGTYPLNERLTIEGDISKLDGFSTIGG